MTEKEMGASEFLKSAMEIMKEISKKRSLNMDENDDLKLIRNIMIRDYPDQLKKDLEMSFLLDIRKNWKELETIFSIHETISKDMKDFLKIVEERRKYIDLYLKRIDIVFHADEDIMKDEADGDFSRINAHKELLHNLSDSIIRNSGALESVASKTSMKLFDIAMKSDEVAKIRREHPHLFEFEKEMED